jgi:hypothetical protein
LDEKYLVQDLYSELNITEASLNELLTNVTLSTMSLGIWKQPTLVTTTEYRNTYHFSRPMNLILPYSLCLGIGIIIIILGLWSLYQNEIPAADGSFLQIVMAIKGGTKLEELVIKQGLVGSTEASKELKELKVRFGELVSDGY